MMRTSNTERALTVVMVKRDSVDIVLIDWYTVSICEDGCD